MMMMMMMMMMMLIIWGRDDVVTMIRDNLEGLEFELQ